MIPLHPSHQEAVYDCLRPVPPFARWKLPPVEEVHFTVTQAKDRIGSYCLKENGHHITALSDKVGHCDTLARLVAHVLLDRGRAWQSARTAIDPDRRGTRRLSVGSVSPGGGRASRADRSRGYVR